ncbi:unnamed protein product, partial [Amoebophrya sp. A25]|eukprot:GSA25T00020359001.1
MSRDNIILFPFHGKLVILLSWGSGIAFILACLVAWNLHYNGTWNMERTSGQQFSVPVRGFAYDRPESALLGETMQVVNDGNIPKTHYRLRKLSDNPAAERNLRVQVEATAASGTVSVDWQKVKSRMRMHLEDSRGNNDNIELEDHDESSEMHQEQQPGVNSAQLPPGPTMLFVPGNQGNWKQMMN